VGAAGGGETGLSAQQKSDRFYIQPDTGFSFEQADLSRDCPSAGVGDGKESMLNYVIKRLLGLIPTLLIVAVLVFLFVHMLPGDPARLIAGPEADAQVVAMVRQQLGLDQPLHVQFWHYITNVAGRFWHLDGVASSGSSEIASRFMPTFWLTLASMSWAVLFGMAAGIVAAVWRNRWPDRLGMALAVTGIFPGVCARHAADAGLLR
jgi:ABC-type antimicrobial peptide transport system permease subunit